MGLKDMFSLTGGPNAIKINSSDRCHKPHSLTYHFRSTTKVRLEA